jgi:hypothetical protein
MRWFRIFQLLDDFLGRSGIDLNLLAKMIVKLGKIAEEIYEPDVNPLLVLEYRFFTVDGLLRLSKALELTES